MNYVRVLLITVANSVLFFVASMMAVSGDGGTGGIKIIWVFGYSWIAVTTGIALALCARGEDTKARSVAAFALPAGFVLTLLLMLAGQGFVAIWPRSAALGAACLGTGATFVATPSNPVRSIAYDWRGPYAPQLNYLSMFSNGRIKEARGGSGNYPRSIQFIESRCCQYMGAPSNHVGPYVSYLNTSGDKESHGVTELSADALVVYQMTSKYVKGENRELTQYDVVVSDRRDGKLLGKLRYLADSQYRWACGTTSDGVMDERAFVLKAIGVQ